MAMSKKETAALEEALHQVKIARALSWPGYDRPVAVTEDRVRVLHDMAGLRLCGSGGVDVFYPNEFAMTVTHGQTNGSTHARDFRYPNSRQKDIGFCFESEADAWRWIRHKKTEKAAAELLEIDGRIAAATPWRGRRGA